MISLRGAESVISECDCTRLIYPRRAPVFPRSYDSRVLANRNVGRFASVGRFRECGDGRPRPSSRAKLDNFSQVSSRSSKKKLLTAKYAKTAKKFRPFSENYLSSQALLCDLCG